MAFNKIILKHGSSTPNESVISAMTLGEILVQHGSGATETMLHTLDGNSGLTSFPSTAWVEAKVTAAAKHNELVGGTNVAVSAETNDEGVKVYTIDTNENVLLKKDKVLLTEVNLSDDEHGVNVVKTGNDETGYTYEIAAHNLASVKDVEANTELINGLQKTIVDNEKVISAGFNKLNTKVNTLEDMIYGTGATEVIDTLQDVIEWIGTGSGETAANIIADIENLQKTLTGFTSENTVSAKTESLEKEIAALSKSIEDGLGNIDQDFIKAITYKNENLEEVTQTGGTFNMSTVTIDCGTY